MGWVPNTGFLQYGPQLIKHRKLFHQFFNKQECLSYNRIQYQEACKLIENLTKNQTNYDKCFRRFAVAIILKIAYGHDVVSDDDYFLKLTDDIAFASNNSGPVGNTPLDWFPIC